MNRSLGELIQESLKSVYNTIIGTVSLLLSVALWFLLPNTQVSLRIVVPIVALVLVLLVTVAVTLLNAAIQANREANEERGNHQEVQAEYNNYRARGAGGLPKVIEGRNPLPGREAALMCVLEPSELFPRHTLLCFFSVSRQGVEEQVGVGLVTHVQTDRKIHATMTNVEEGQEDFAERLRQNEGEAVRITFVKPVFPTEYTDS